MNSKKNRNRHFASTHVRPFRLWQDNSVNQDVRIELIPLIDVIFCILTFFILAAVNFSRQQAISLDLPQAKTGTPQMREMLVVSLDDLGQVYVEQQQVSRNQLTQSIKNYRQSNPSGLMVLYAAKNATYREVVEILDILREVGGDRVALATLPQGSQPTNNPTTIPLQPNPALPGLPNNYNPYNIPAPPNPPSE
ncbi:MAG: ExbD/TolR family protein [Xenococcaceae cyanobacterium]